MRAFAVLALVAMLAVTQVAAYDFTVFNSTDCTSTSVNQTIPFMNAQACNVVPDSSNPASVSFSCNTTSGVATIQLYTGVTDCSTTAAATGTSDNGACSGPLADALEGYSFAANGCTASGGAGSSSSSTGGGSGSSSSSGGESGSSSTGTGAASTLSVSALLVAALAVLARLSL